MDTRNGRPSTAPRQESDPAIPSRKRQRVEENTEPSPNVPSNDRQAWYYPGSAVDDDDAGELPPGITGGNWGRKHIKGARFLRRDHISAWGPTRAQYDVEERARKRLRTILPEVTGKPVEQDPILPHLRSPSPPFLGPFAPAPIHHSSYTASVFDPNVGASFRSNLLNSLERSASDLIQSEIGVHRALGRFWTVLTETANRMAKEHRHALMEEQEPKLSQQRPNMDVEPTDSPPLVNGEEAPQTSVVPPYPAVPSSRLTELDEFTTPNVVMNMFTVSKDITFYYPSSPADLVTVSYPAQVDVVKRALLAIRELQEDNRECMERLEDIRELLGKVKGLRDAVWAIMRSRAIKEIEHDIEE
ncbi:hypothetical protein FRB91_002850 [Serendipita sp. 411]|nr:hypothetical protein FRB91_002850 [Serendipita sp. 411]